MGQSQSRVTNTTNITVSKREKNYVNAAIESIKEVKAKEHMEDPDHWEDNMMHIEQCVLEDGVCALNANNYTSMNNAIIHYRDVLHLFPKSRYGATEFPKTDIFLNMTDPLVSRSIRA